MDADEVIRLREYGIYGTADQAEQMRRWLQACREYVDERVWRHVEDDAVLRALETELDR